jgi:hypothetical protein
MTLHHGKYSGIVQGSPRRTDTPTEIVSPFGDIGQVEQITAEEAAAVIWHIDRLATDARDADRLKRALGLVGAR